jgi:hypothetical protein
MNPTERRAAAALWRVWQRGPPVRSHKLAFSHVYTVLIKRTQSA